MSLTSYLNVGSKPLLQWHSQVKSGHIRRIIDDEVKSLVMEISGSNVATTFITCPENTKPRASLGISLPFFVMVIKNMKKYFTFEIQILDDTKTRRRFRISNFQSTTKVLPFCTTMPIGLNPGWNQVQFNLADFTKRAYGTTYIETVRVQIHANIRIRRLYFAESLYSEEDMPDELRLFSPPTKKSKEPVKQTSGVKVTVSTEKSSEEMPPPPSSVDEAPSEETERGKPSSKQEFEEGVEMRGKVWDEQTEEEEEEFYYEEEEEEEYYEGVQFKGGIIYEGEEEEEINEEEIGEEGHLPPPGTAEEERKAEPEESAEPAENVEASKPDEIGEVPTEKTPSNETPEEQGPDKEQSAEQVTGKEVPSVEKVTNNESSGEKLPTEAPPESLPAEEPQ